MKKIFLLSLILGIGSGVSGQERVSVKLHPEQAQYTISKHIYGQFAEHLGACIYGGIWVGENSPIPNTSGYRNDVLEALKKLQIPVLRWPGGCFADEYHWIDGIGSRDKRPKMVNNNWGGVVEDNSFGTHEFLNLCEMLGCEPYISGNAGSGTVEELAKWVEYMTSEGDSPMANLRRQNGREQAWKVKYLGVGNESWGCGGDMLPDYYADVFRRYAVYCRNFDTNRLFKIASGASDYDYNWTEVLMKKAKDKMNGLSLHYYTIKEWGEGKKGAATQFTEEEYYWTLGKALEIEEVLQKHIAIMDKYDPDKKVGLMVDEWGTWFNVEEGTNPGFLYQQNTMRDAMVAALTLNTFNKYADRIHMANIAQIVNVLQSMILTKEDKMLLTPTYHVFEMYRVHQDAKHIPLETVSDTKVIRERNIQTVNVSASQKDNVINISLTNIDLKSDKKVRIDLSGMNIRQVTGRILKAGQMNAHNTFEHPDAVKPDKFTDFILTDGLLDIELPTKSIVVMELR
ncbi:MAG: alpha-N-arabinofuranosidase [Dysgonamonadaceae bacterium]|nr:alpha-N-arabinofuranosidase [Dysgonamonadaceae bacterium]